MRSILLIVAILGGCSKSPTQTPPTTPPPQGYEKTPQAISISGATINEASGIASSSTFADRLWVHEDSGNPPRIYLLKTNGEVADSFEVNGAANRDWEEMQRVTGLGGESFLYLADIGDNDAKYPDYTIYRMPEPLPGQDSIRQLNRIRFQYPDGSHDAEAFLVQPSSDEFYIITKRESRSRVYKLPAPADGNVMNTAVFVMELPYNNVVSAAVAADGRSIAVKTYTHIYHYPALPSEKFDAVLARKPDTLDYAVEPQGEAMCFGFGGEGFYTLSEEAFGVVPMLYFYRKKG